MRPARLFITALAAAASAACGTDVSGPSASLFSCVLGTPRTLAVGEVVHVRGADNQALCLTGAGETAELVYVPFFGREPPDDEDDPILLEVEVTGAGVGPATGAAAGDGAGAMGPGAIEGFGAAGDIAAGRSPDEAFHDRHLRRQREELGPRIRSGAAGGPGGGGGEAGLGGAVAADVPSQGDLLELNVAISCTAMEVRTGRVEYVSDRAVVVADVGNPAGGLEAADYAYFGETFDTLIDPVDTDHFGEPTDIDQNQRAIIFFTRAVNELTPASSETFVGGFFWSGDLFPETDTPRLQACPAANQAEMFYMLAADPTGVVNGNVFETDFVRAVGPSIIAHEYQHLINAARRLYVNNAGQLEDVWLDEGLSHAAEELVFMDAAGLGPGQNLSAQDVQAAPNGVEAFNRYMSGNITNFRRFLQRPDTASLMGIDVLPTRGAAWAFLRYAADRAGRGDAAFFQDVVNSTRSGVANLDGVTDGATLAWMRDWTVAVYADDAVPGIPARLTQPSWDFRALYTTIGGSYPLRVLSLASGEAERVTLRPGGAAYLRFAISADGRGAIHVEADGGIPGHVLLGSLVRTR